MKHHKKFSAFGIVEQTEKNAHWVGKVQAKHVLILISLIRIQADCHEFLLCGGRLNGELL